LSNLELLDLSYNMLKILPPEIAECKDLREMYLNNNDILFLPKIMTHMPKLEFLEISSNLLHFLPATPFLSRPVIHIGYNHKLNWGSIQALQQNLMNINYNSPAIDPSNR
jgi:Leucine-rich repeat (LRR) protein